MARPKYAQVANPTITPQSEPIPDSGQVANNAGGYGWRVDKWQQLDRFLILGSVGGTYYVKESDLTKLNLDAIKACIEEDGLKVLNRIESVSVGGRAAKNDPALFALALCASSKTLATRKGALGLLKTVARTGTHLFTFLEYAQQLRGWGRALKRAVAHWYLDKDVEALAYQLLKYQQREGWSHRDALRLAHPLARTSLNAEMRNALFKWVTTGELGDLEFTKAIPLINGYSQLKGLDLAGKGQGSRIAQIIRDYKLPREALPTEALNMPEVWEALLQDMPMKALIRNLGNLSKHGVLAPGKWDNIEKVVSKLTDITQLHKARVHPLSILIAQRTYASGQGFRGHGAWEVVPQIVDALDKAFYASFMFVEPAGKRMFIGLDVSGSMGSQLGDLPITCAEAAAALGMVWFKTEPKVLMYGFANVFRDLKLTPNMTLGEVTQRTAINNFGGTDCSLPITYAMSKGIEIDTFVIITDSETWFGKVHPAQALAQYRKQTGINAKLAVLGMESNDISIADPNDPGMLDFVGFDTGLPDALAAFIKE